MKHTIICASIIAVSAIASFPVLADNGSIQSTLTQINAALRGQPTTLGPTQTGQPNQSCEDLSLDQRPGNTLSAPGSAFNPDGQAGQVYAGEQPQNSRNSASVSQYDVACSKQPVL